MVVSMRVGTSNRPQLISRRAGHAQSTEEQHMKRWCIINVMQRPQNHTLLPVLHLIASVYSRNLKRPWEAGQMGSLQGQSWTNSRQSD